MMVYELISRLLAMPAGAQVRFVCHENDFERNLGDNGFSDMEIRTVKLREKDNEVRVCGK